MVRYGMGCIVLVCFISTGWFSLASQKFSDYLIRCLFVVSLALGTCNLCFICSDEQEGYIFSLKGGYVFQHCIVSAMYSFKREMKEYLVGI